MHISILVSSCYISTLTKNIWKIEKKVKNLKNSSCPSFVFDQNLFIAFFSMNDFFAQTTFSCSL